MSGTAGDPTSSDSMSGGAGDTEFGSTPDEARISRELRALYESVQEEGIPDRFLDLLEKLDQAEKAHAARHK